MPEYSVEEGDCIESIAAQYGSFWETVWNHPRNQELKSQRKNPNTLMPGDVVFVPDRALKEQACSTDQKHRFKRKGVPSMLRIRLLNEDGPRRSERYILVIDGKTYSGSTDPEGWLKHPVRPEARSGTLLVGDDQDEYTLELGHLDPIEEISGVQARLNNLDFNCGPVDGVLGPSTAAAIRRFQRAYKLPITGKSDDATTRKLVEVHKC
jgi:N-acetylmuramoyl-L-alanine amidase